MSSPFHANWMTLGMQCPLQSAISAGVQSETEGCALTLDTASVRAMAAAAAAIVVLILAIITVARPCVTRWAAVCPLSGCYSTSLSSSAAAVAVADPLRREHCSDCSSSTSPYRRWREVEETRPECCSNGPAGDLHRARLQATRIHAIVKR